MLTFYRYLGYPLFFILSFLLWPVIPSKLRQSIKIKFQRKPPPFHQPTILIHAASGEIEYAKSVIRAIEDQKLPFRILVTYSSPSFLKLYQPSEQVKICPLPFDFYFLMLRFFRYYNVKYIFVARSDLWANFALCAKHLNIPLYYFSVTQSKSVKHLGFFKRHYLQSTYRLVTKILAVSKTDFQNLKSLLPDAENIEILGDTRFDQALYRIDQSKNSELRLPQLSEGHLRLILGSTWPQDEIHWIPILLQLLSETRIQSLVIAPHEPSTIRLKSIEGQIASLGLSSIRFSQLNTSKQSTQDQHRVILVDTTGVLAELYLQSHLAFVGGSFRSKVHSVMEPLVAGLPVSVGPLHHNNREALEFSKLSIHDSNHLMVTAIADAIEALGWAKSISSLEQNLDVKAIIQSKTLEFSGATAQLLKSFLTDIGHFKNNS